MTLTPQQRKLILNRLGIDWPGPYTPIKRGQIEALLVALDEEQVKTAALREDLMRCGSLAVSDRLDGSLGKRRADRITEIVWAACWPETKR